MASKVRPDFALLLAVVLSGLYSFLREERLSTKFTNDHKEKQRIPLCLCHVARIDSSGASLWSFGLLGFLKDFWRDESVDYDGVCCIGKLWNRRAVKSDGCFIR